MAKKARTPKAVRYGEAVDEIEQILESIDRDDVDIDDLSDKVERAVELIRVCQDKLRATEARVTQALEGLAELAAEEDAPESSSEEAEGEPASEDQDREEEEDLPF